MGVISENAAALLAENLEKATALLVGPGLGLEDTTLAFMRRLLSPQHGGRKRKIGFAGPPETAPGQPPAPVTLPPMVVDADGLKLLAKLENWPALLPALSILTPHPGEMAALTGLDKDLIQADRLATAEKYAVEWGHVVVLKGAYTVIASPDGATAVIPVASAALARAGTGDVLAGLIAGLRAQGVEPFSAALAGAWIHAHAGLAAADDLGSTAAVLAGDVLNAVPQILSQLDELAA
jgi:NAD(P)H-hydrate epimerase